MMMMMMMMSQNCRSLYTVMLYTASRGKNVNKKLCGRPPQYAPPLQVDLWPFDHESGVRVTCDTSWATSVPILVFLGLSVLDLGPMYATDRRQTCIIA